ncbi:helix-turn-helix transcriptional regulator [Solirubrobacter sp. CPCC 204708]|uniref:Helix-turn-helix transcriptional regulator n=1 Tax=Solirubrobacter deserti TaxID=2282478 RepID=A0ABT4RKE0_9ACTN|nr:helix-turn-helix transcriptional regulator [Solirubrobacter deserti]MBE2317288.1 helix-turn-helix transcriptional regulator [Solirubrobacter deserti]MDA0139019.1 helix-turn-helix transcriptional regulator [Solirubrobacter deserti]
MSREDVLLGLAVDALHALIPASLVVALAVDESGTLDREVASRGRSEHAAPAERLAELLRRLEPVDPFSPRRAQDRRDVVLSVAEIGGTTRFFNSIYGRRLLDNGYGYPAFLYLRRDRRIVAAIGLFREAGMPPFEPANLLLLRRLSLLLEQSLLVGAAEAVAADPLAAREPVDALTRRERQVAALVASGSSNADIAQALAMSQATVKTHLTKIYAKVGVRTRTQLAVVLGAAPTVASA